MSIVGDWVLQWITSSWILRSPSSTNNSIIRRDLYDHRCGLYLPNALEEDMTSDPLDVTVFGLGGVKSEPLTWSRSSLAEV
jgi:hypothetical protein